MTDRHDSASARPVLPDERELGFTTRSKLDIPSQSSDIYCVEWPGLDDRLIALKVLMTGAAEDVERMFDEGNALAARFRHPTVVPVLRSGTFSDGRHWAAMPYYPRGSLADLGPLSLPDVLRIGVRLADVLDVLHAARALHRDIKPANILLGEDGEPALTDLSVVGQLRGEAESAVTTWATTRFSAPEVRKNGYSVRSEIYSLGRTLADLLSDHSADPTEAGIDAPAEVTDLLATMMARDPAQRPASCAEVARALRGVQRRLGLPETDAIAAVADDEREPADPEADVASGRAADVRSPDRTRRWVWAVVAVVGLPALLLYGLLVWSATAAFVRWYEEPTLVRTFGGEYEVYRAAVQDIRLVAFAATLLET